MNWCLVGLHDYHYIREVELRDTSCGPFADPWVLPRRVERCCHCGKERYVLVTYGEGI